MVPPSIRDPRLHVSAVILSVHLLGQTALDFEISIPQIAFTLLTCAAIDLVVVALRTGALVWPGSALLTGGGISLVLRVPGTEHGEYWSLHGWYWFVGVAAFGLATKHLVRWRGVHVFNPSNVALVAAFLVFGSSRIEPLDFWWGRFDLGMAAAYAVILVGGLTIGRRLALTPMVVAFWVTLAAGMALVVAIGHSISARWSFVPVDGLHFWWIIVTSPEVLVFLFFMLTDPRTVPAGRVARVVFSVAVGLACTVLIAPQTTEFAAKVGLLAGLVVMCPTRHWLDRRLPVPGSEEDRLLPFARRVLGAPGGRLRPGRLAAVAAAVVALTGTVVVAAVPARPTATAADVATDFRAVDVAALPDITWEPRVSGFRADLDTPAGARALVETLAHNLSVEGEAILVGDPALLTGVVHGDRLDAVEAQIIEAEATGRRTVSTYVFDALNLSVVFPQGVQTVANAGVEAQGTVERVTYDDAGMVVDRIAAPLDHTFTLRIAPAGGWETTDLYPGTEPTPIGE